MVSLGIERARAGWLAIGAVLGLLVVLTVYAFLGTFVFAVFIYYATRPGYRRIRRWVKSPSLAAALALFVLALPLLVLLSYTVAIGLQEFGRFAANSDLGPYQEVLAPYINVSELVRDPGSILRNPDLTRNIGAVLDEALAYAGLIGTALLHAFVMFALAFYMLRDGPRLSRWFRTNFADDRGVLAAYLDAVDADLHKVFSGNIYNAIITAAIGAITYSLLNLVSPTGLAIPYPALVGLLAGGASLIPVVGMKLVYFPVSAYLFGVSFLRLDEPILWFPVAFFAISFVVVDTIPDLVLRPYVSGRNLHVGLVMFAYIFGPLLFGWYGIFLGPLLLVLVIHFGRLVLPELMSGTPIQPFAVDPAYGAVDGPPAPDAEPPSTGAEPRATGDAAGNPGRSEEEGDGAADPPGDPG